MGPAGRSKSQRNPLDESSYLCLLPGEEIIQLSITENTVYIVFFFPEHLYAVNLFYWRKQLSSLFSFLRQSVQLHKGASVLTSCLVFLCAGTVCDCWLCRRGAACLELGNKRRNLPYYCPQATHTPLLSPP